MSAAGFYLEDLTLGQFSERMHTVVEADIEAFATVSGDRNPVHLDEAYAVETQFKGRIAHGMLGTAYISAILGMDLLGRGRSTCRRRWRSSARCGSAIRCWPAPPSPPSTPRRPV